MTAEKRIECALRSLPGQHVLTSSFGAQSAVMLHLLEKLQLQLMLWELVKKLLKV